MIADATRRIARAVASGLLCLALGGGSAALANPVEKGAVYGAATGAIVSIAVGGNVLKGAVIGGATGAIIGATKKK